VQTDL